MRKKLTATTIANLQVEEGKAYAKLFDTEVTGLGVRKTAKGVARIGLLNRLERRRGS